MRNYLICLFTFCSIALQAQVPEWIWHPDNGATPTNNETRFFRKTFSVKSKPDSAILSIAADDEAEIWINGKRQSDVKGWNNAVNANIAKKIKVGENLIAIRGFSGTGDAALLAKIDLSFGKGKKSVVISDASWKSAATAENGWETVGFSGGTNWVSAKSKGKLGVAPWGDVMKTVQATRAEDLVLLPGFKVELLKSAQAGEGSWICMTTDDKGRLIISPQQDDLPLVRVTLGKDGQIKKWESLAAPLHQAMGLLYAHNSLYANCHGPEGTGLYRLIDANKNDQFETNEVHFLKKIPGEGEHGYHALVLGPDKMIYMMNGNHTKLPEGISPNSPHKNYNEDFLLTREWDAGGHAVGILAPGGHLLRTDAEGKKWEIMLGGFRNTYDFGFNADGEMFAFDSDMEWEWGMPWYKPTRILHCVSGADFGWRSGSAKWPASYADSLPAAVNIGLGSPTGVKFGTKSNFPGEYRTAFFAMDWSYGRILAVHLKPVGASYSATYENFVKGKPLNVTDLEFGQDGAMYFITGGRGTQSGLYRVSSEASATEKMKSRDRLAAEKQSMEARKIRRKLEKFHGTTNPNAVETAWPFLKSEDRWLRYAARIAIEAQPVSEWKDRAINEPNPEAALTSLLALARVGGKETQKDLLMALKKFPLDSLSEMQKLEKLRVIELSFIRQGKPEPALAKIATEKLNAQYPAKTEAMNRELCQLLIYLEAPGVVEKTLALIDKAKTQEEQIHYIFHLRNLKSGWTLEQREKYFSWFKWAQQSGKAEVTYPQGSAYTVWADQAKAGERHPADMIRWFKEVDRDYGDGASYGKQLELMRKEAIANLSDIEKVQLAEIIGGKIAEATPKPVAKERKFVKEWTVAELEKDLEKVSAGRNFESGKSAFNDSQCLACHRFGNEGGAVGPELTAASSKYSRRDILDSILNPSKIVSDQYQNHTISKKDGDELTGRIVDENDQRIAVQANPLSNDRIEIKKADITKRAASKLSPMPEGLANILTKDEILDLLAYIESMGKPKAANFKK